MCSRGPHCRQLLAGEPHPLWDLQLPASGSLTAVERVGEAVLSLSQGTNAKEEKGDRQEGVCWYGSDTNQQNLKAPECRQPASARHLPQDPAWQALGPGLHNEPEAELGFKLELFQLPAAFHLVFTTCLTQVRGARGAFYY